MLSAGPGLNKNIERIFYFTQIGHSRGENNLFFQRTYLPQIGEIRYFPGRYFEYFQVEPAEQIYTGKIKRGGKKYYLSTFAMFKQNFMCLAVQLQFPHHLQLRLVFVR